MTHDPTAVPDPALATRWLEGLRTTGDALLAVPPTSLDAPVPACPGWDVAELVRHVGILHWWFAVRVRDAPGDEHRRRDHPSPPGDPTGLLAWGGDQLDLLEHELRAAHGRDGLVEIVSTWVGPQPAWWVARRMCHETLVHAWDAQDATGTPAELVTDLAVDAVEETFDLFLPNRFDPVAFGGTGETLHLHATDAEGEWLLRFDPAEVVVAREHAKGDVAVRGPAGQLLLALWGRQPFVGDGARDLEVFGDAELLDRYRASAAV